MRVGTACRRCQGTIPKKRLRYHAKFCSESCEKEYNRAQYVKVTHNLPTGTIGTLSELRVTVDLLCKGYYVFRSMSLNCPCDLVILKNGKAIRVEVKTGHYYKEQLRPGKSVSAKERHYDVLAVVPPDGAEVAYYGSFD